MRAAPRDRCGAAAPQCGAGAPAPAFPARTECAPHISWGLRSCAGFPCAHGVRAPHPVSKVRIRTMRKNDADREGTGPREGPWLL